MPMPLLTAMPMRRRVLRQLNDDAPPPPPVPNLSQHPLFQTLVLPLLLALLGMAALRLWPGERWASLGATAGLLVALAWWPGFDWPAHSRAMKLPWVVLAGLGLALLATAREATGARPLSSLVLAVVAWVGAVLWLAGGQASPPLLAGAGLLGVAVLWPLAGGRGHAAAPAKAGSGLAVPAERGALAVLPELAVLAVLAVAALGLAALAATGGSLLLAQLAGMVATTAVAMAGWAWLRPSARMAKGMAEGMAGGTSAGTAAAMAAPMALPMVVNAGGYRYWPLALAWLSIAWAWVLAEPAAGSMRALQVALLALAFGVPALLSRGPAAALAPRWRPWVTPAAALLAALAVALAWWAGTASAPMPDTALDPNDPYLIP